MNANLVATAVRAFMETGTEWSGTATDLLELLGKVAGEKATRAKTWPADATRLGGRLRRAATFLRKVGIEDRHRQPRRAGADPHHHHHFGFFRTPRGREFSAHSGRSV